MNKTTKIVIGFSENPYISGCSEAKRTFTGDTCWFDASVFLRSAVNLSPGELRPDKHWRTRPGQKPVIPSRMGYDKTDFTVTWEDGETYEGRLDLKPTSCGERESDTDIAQHIRRHCIFYGGLAMTPEHRNAWHWMTEDKYAAIVMSSKPEERQTYLRFLQDYQIGQAA